MQGTALDWIPYPQEAEHWRVSFWLLFFFFVFVFESSENTRKKARSARNVAVANPFERVCPFRNGIVVRPVCFGGNSFNGKTTTDCGIRSQFQII